MSEVRNWLLFLHILSAVTLFMAHGAAAASDEAIIEQARKSNVAEVVVAGYVIPAFVLWLMVFRPF